jgi:hypothetical protein
MATDRVSPAASREMPAAAEESSLLDAHRGACPLRQRRERHHGCHQNIRQQTHPDNLLCPHAPPLLSRFCIHTRDGAAIFCEPKIIVTQEDLALIRVDTDGCSLSGAYYLYQADDGSGKPSLTLLPRAPGGLHFHPKDFGLLRLPGKEYIVAGFRFLPFSESKGGFALCVYDSKFADWKVYALSLSPQGQQEYGDTFFSP